VSIRDRIEQVRREIPDHVSIVAAVKTRSVDEIRAALDAGITMIGHNYVQEAAASLEALGVAVGSPQPGERDAFSAEPSAAVRPEQFAIDLIGHLQRNKAKVAVQLFDRIQTVDSIRLASALDRECAKIGRTMPILIEINSAREPQKSGVLPAAAIDLVREISVLTSIRVEGLMTMGPFLPDPEAIRPHFAETKQLLDEIAALRIPNVEMRVLSMGMSDSYRVAIEEGATMIRLGTTLFGPRATQQPV